MDPLAAAVWAEPDDDLPRLIYADWLDDRGDPRGSFIRAQVELNRLPADHPDRHEWASLESELLETHEDEWLGDLADELISSWFHRGFIEVRLDVRRFLTGPTAWLDHPTVGGIHLYGPRQMSAELLAQLMSDPRTQRVRSLFLGFEYLRDAGADLIAGSLHLGQLIALDLGTNGIGDAGAMALARSVGLASLRHLNLANNVIADAGAAALASMPRLKHLDLTNNEISSVGATALAGGPGLTEVTRLKLAGNAFDGRTRGARALRKRFAEAATWR